MAIIYNEDKKVFNIKSKNTSYALMVADTGCLSCIIKCKFGYGGISAQCENQQLRATIQK